MPLLHKSKNSGYFPYEEIRCRRCGLTRKASKNLWKKSRISPYWKGRLVRVFLSGCTSISLAFSGPLQPQASILRWFRMLRRGHLRNTIKDLEPLSGEVEMDETMFGGRRPGKRSWGATGKCMIFNIHQRNGNILTFPIYLRAKETMNLLSPDIPRQEVFIT